MDTVWEQNGMWIRLNVDETREFLHRRTEINRRLKPIFRLARGVAEHTRSCSARLLATQETMDRVRRTLARQERQKAPQPQGGGALVVAAMAAAPAMKVLKFRVEEDEKRAMDESGVDGPADDIDAAVVLPVR